jgi:hypothetical protein
MSTSDSPTKPRRQLVDVIRVLVTVVLGGIGAAAGFTHTHDWAVHHGQTGWLAWADAVVIEGMAIVAGFEIHRDHHTHTGKRRRVTFPTIVLVAGFGIQMAAQVALAERTVAGWLLAAMPALGFLVVVKLLMRRAPGKKPTPAPAPVLAEPDTTTDPTPIPAPAPTREPAPVPVPAPEPGEITDRLPVTEPARVPRLKLPADMTERITTAVHEARDAGREPTTDDIRRAVKVSDHMAAQILTTYGRNGHALTH